MPSYTSTTLGSVDCDFISKEDFLTLCSRWLASDTAMHVVTLNPEMVVEAERDQDFLGAVKRANIRIPDGAGLVWARWYLRSQFWSLWPSLFAFSFRYVDRIPGVEAVSDLARIAEKQSRSIYLLGGTERELQKTKSMLTKKFPSLTIHISAPHIFSMDGPDFIVQDIIAKKPDILFVAYGAPKQSIWIDHMLSTFPSVRIAIGVGGAFSILSEEKPRAPYFFRKRNLEWLWRLFLEPARLPRIWRAVISFPLLIHSQKKTRNTA